MTWNANNSEAGGIMGSFLGGDGEAFIRRRAAFPCLGICYPLSGPDLSHADAVCNEAWACKARKDLG